MDKEEVYWSNTNSADDSKGVVWGLDGNLFTPLLAAAVGSFCLVFLGIALKFPLMLVLLIGGAPTPLTYLYLYLFVSNKPPHYREDLVNYLISKGCATPKPIQDKNMQQFLDYVHKDKGGNQ